jgi:hypothetical protein
MRLFPAHADFYNTGIILNQLSHRLAPEAPKLGQIADPVMLLKSGILGEHSETITRQLRMETRAGKLSR